VALPELINSHTAHDVEYEMYYSPCKIGRHFAAGTLYELSMLEWIYERKIPENAIALDVGANIGNHTLWMAAVCGLQIHAFEPVMPHAVYANVVLNSLNHVVTVWPCGLGSEPGKFYHEGKGVLKPGQSKQSTDEAFEILRLDDLGIEDVALMKIDVEGMELDVLKGGLATIERDRPVILTEEWEMSTTNAIQRLIGRFGYRRVHGFGGRGRAPVGVWEAK